MAEDEYIILYTSQKTKKAKIWHDGFLKVSTTGTKAVLYDDKKSRLDTVFIRAADVVVGEQIESDRYLILIEEKKCGGGTPSVSSQSENVPTAAATPGVRSGMMTSSQGRGSGGLRKRKMGFVPPRLVRSSEENCQRSPEVEPSRSERTLDVSPLQGLSSYKASLTRIYGQRSGYTEGLLGKKNDKDKLTNVTEVCRDGISSSPHLPSHSFSGTLSDDSRVSPQLSSFMSKLKSTCVQGQDIQRRNPWKTFGSRSSSQESQSSETGIHLSIPNVLKSTTEDLQRENITKPTSNPDSNLQSAESTVNMAEHGSRRTASQIMALFKKSSFRGGGHDVDQNQNVSTDAHVPDMFPKETVKSNFSLTSREVRTDCTEAEIIEHSGFMKDSVESKVTTCLQVPSVSGDCNDVELKDYVQPEVLDSDIFDTSDAVFDINFSPLSEVLESEDEDNINKECKFQDISMMNMETNETVLKQEECSQKGQSRVVSGDTEISDNVSNIKSESACELRRGDSETCSIEDVKLSPSVRTESEPNIRDETEAQDSSGHPNEKFESDQCSGACERSQKIFSDVGHENMGSTKLQLSSSSQNVSDSFGSPKATNGGSSPKATKDDSHPLNHLQLTPDSFDLDSSFTHLSDSGFLGTLCAGTKDTCPKASDVFRVTKLNRDTKMENNLESKELFKETKDFSGMEDACIEQNVFSDIKRICDVTKDSYCEIKGVSMVQTRELRGGSASVDVLPACPQKKEINVSVEGEHLASSTKKTDVKADTGNPTVLENRTDGSVLQVLQQGADTLSSNIQDTFSAEHGSKCQEETSGSLKRGDSFSDCDPCEMTVRTTQAHVVNKVQDGEGKDLTYVASPESFSRLYGQSSQSSKNSPVLGPSLFQGTNHSTDFRQPWNYQKLSQREYLTSDSMISVPVLSQRNCAEKSNFDRGTQNEVHGNNPMASTDPYPLDATHRSQSVHCNTLGTLSSLPHPSQLCKMETEPNTPVNAEKPASVSRDVHQMASKHLETYTVKGAVSSTVVKRETTRSDQDDLPGLMRSSVYVVRTDASGSLAQTRGAFEAFSRHEDAVSRDRGMHFQLHDDQHNHPPSYPVAGGLSHWLNTDDEVSFPKFFQGEKSMNNSPNDSASIRVTSENRWLVSDSQSSTSTADSGLEFGGILGRNRKYQSVQQLSSESSSQDELEKEFYNNWSQEKLDFKLKPVEIKCSPIQMSGIEQAVEVPASVSEEDLQSCLWSLSPAQAVPSRGKSEDVFQFPSSYAQTLSASSVQRPSRKRPLLTDPDSDCHAVDSGHPDPGRSSDQAVPGDAKVRSSSGLYFSKGEQEFLAERSRCIDVEGIPADNFNTMLGLGPAVEDERNKDQDLCGSAGLLTSSLRAPSAVSYQSSWHNEGNNHAQGIPYRYQGSARWQQQRTENLAAEHAAIDEQSKERSRWSKWERYLMMEDRTLGPASKWEDRESMNSERRDPERFVSLSNRNAKENFNGSMQECSDSLGHRRKQFYQGAGCKSVYTKTSGSGMTQVERRDDMCGSDSVQDIDFDDDFQEEMTFVDERNVFADVGNTLKSNVKASSDNFCERLTVSARAITSKNMSDKFSVPRFVGQPKEPECTMKLSQLDTPGTQSLSASVNVSKKIGLSKFSVPVVSALSNSCLMGTQRNLCGELQFPTKNEVEVNVKPVRQLSVPTQFPNVQGYRQVFIAALREHLNILLFEQAKLYHGAMGKVDISKYSDVGGTSQVSDGKFFQSSNPACKCGTPSKMVQVKKAGPNTGRFFYACTAPRNQQCKFFQWMDQADNKQTVNSSATSLPQVSLTDADSISSYVRGHGITFYCESHFLLKHKESYNKSSFKKGIPAWVRNKMDETKKKSMYIRLSKKDVSSYFGKDDLWVVSQSLDFQTGTTFTAQSVYFGPNSNNEVEIEPISGFSPSNWTSNTTCHAVHAGNASSELACLLNLENHVQPMSLPILPHILARSCDEERKHAFVPNTTKLCTPGKFVISLAESYVQRYNLNEDQAEALNRVASMMNKDSSSVDPILLIHGVFGAGKSFLLSVIIRFLVEVFEKNDMYTPDVPFPWKLLISSTTNVAVDRVLIGLLELGFEDFIRVGSVKKIAKPVLPYSVHASGSDSQELKDLQQMLRSDIPPSEKQLVRRSIEKHRLGENKKKLGGVRVVGVTCAACSFNCLDKIQFPFVVLDECSQMTEPASLLPVAKFHCEKLVLVGDPKQLDPTIQGSDAGHDEGLEQTLFDRMMKLGYSPVLLRTQYRCHPWISHISNTLFYNGHLQDGVTLEDRAPLTVMFPTLCFYDVLDGTELTDGSGSYYNEAEAKLTVLLIQALVVEGVPAPNIGVITLYKAQMYKIITSLHSDNASINKEMKCIQVSTVDAFQGGERDVIILSCVRTNNHGFIDSDKRTNVALTRARRHLLIVGHRKNLSRNKLWSRVIRHCHERPSGIQSSSEVITALQSLVCERLSQTSEASCEGNNEGGTSQKRRKLAQKKKRQREDSPPMSLSGDTVQSSGEDSVEIVKISNPLYSPAAGGPQDCENHVQDSVMSESATNVSNKLTRKRPRLSHLINPEIFNERGDNDEDLPSYL